jgi:hypothetical protein
MGAVYAIFVLFLNRILPNVNAEILAKFTSSFDWLINNFLGFGYFYLPMDSIRFAITAVISVWLLCIGIKLTMNLIHLFSAGVVKSKDV